MSEQAPLIWVIDDDRSIRWVLDKALQRAGYRVRGFDSADRALEELGPEEPDTLITDIRMSGTGGLELLSRIQALDASLPVIVITAYSDLDAAVASYEGGAFEYLPKPFDVEEAVELAGRAVASRRPTGGASLPDEGSSELLGEAPAMQEVFRAIGRLSRSSVTVLLTGESGTGKELVARALHRHSPRSGGPFVALNMAAIPHDLMESELFGHEKGAFTGAQQTRRGRFEQAHGGTLFLDEIGDMPAELQTRLLRVLADGEFYRVGAHTSMRVDVRIIAATHQDLQQLVAEGRFREDLYHRLNVIRIQLPTLRERQEDIPALARHFLAASARELNVEPKVLHPDTERLMSRLQWPGNVRQLENTCRWLTVMASGQEIVPEDLPADLRREPPGPADPPSASAPGAAPEAGDWQSALAAWAERALAAGEVNLLEEALPTFERTLIRAALARSGGHRQEAARLLGWGRNTLTRKIKELGME